MQHVTMGLAGLTMAFCVAANAAVSNVFELAFNDSGNPGMDSSGNGNDATLNGGATWVAGGQTGGAIEFEACATVGQGVFETLKAVAKGVLSDLKKLGG